MAFYKGTSFFKLNTATLSYGWSESCYMTTQVSLDQALKDYTTLVNSRLLLLGAGVLNTLVRISDDDIFGDSIAVAGSQPKQANPPCYNPDFNSILTDFANSEMLFRMEAGDKGLYRRAVYMPGLPDVLQAVDIETIMDSTDVNQAKWARKYGNFAAILTNGKYCLKVWNKDPITNPEKKLLKITEPGDVFNVAGHGLAVGDEIRIRLAKSTGESLNGLHTVDTVPDPDHFTILNVPNFVKYVGKGLVRKRIRILSPISAIRPRRFGPRKRGRPFEQPRGRVKARK